MSSTNTREDTHSATISATSFTAGKRSRSNSSSSSSSTSSGSVSGSSVFSRLHTTRSKDGSSSCSSPYSSKTSPASSSSDYSDDERPSKSLRVSERSIGPVQAYPSPSAETVEDAALATLKNKCSLQQSSAVSIQTFGSTPSPVNDSATAGGKSLFVDCLVDATVHVLDMIWHAPVEKSVAFLQNVRSASSISTGEISRPCQCPVGAPFTGGIPLDLFIRETLRRSRTSCSTLQAALLYCKRVGAEAIRKRAEREEVELSDDEHKVLDGRARAYPSLSKSEGQDLSEQLSPRPAVDPILCSRRTFLAAVMISSKFLQDRTFSNRAWSKISGLSVKELGVVERRMLDAIEFDLYVGDDEWLSWTNYLKGDWKSGIDSCRCLSESPPPTSQKSIEPRKTLERTSSLHVNETLDLEACAAPPMRHATCDSIGSSLSHNADSNLSTPTQTPHNEDIGQATPTKHGAHKREPALLPIAISNNISGMRKSVVLTNEVPTPFPLRKGLASRSMSTQ